MDYETEEILKGLAIGTVPSIAVHVIWAITILGTVIIQFPFGWIYFLAMLGAVVLFAYGLTKDRRRTKDRLLDRLPKGATLNEVKWLPEDARNQVISDMQRAKAQSTQVK